MKKDKAYYPSALNLSKYWKYLQYIIQYAKFGDWKSIKTSFIYVLSGKPEPKNRYAKSKLGKFLIRKGTTDFQFINYAYEKNIRDYILKNIDCFDTYVDVGACIGEYCVWLSSLGKEVYAFEPVQANYQGLIENVSINNQEENIKAYNVGLGKDEGMVHFDIFSTVTGSSRISEDQTKKANVKIEVLDQVLNESQIPDDRKVIIKLDVEGMEVEVLKGAKNFLKRMSFIGVIYEHSFAGADEIKSFLESTGNYTYQALDDYNTIAIRK